MSTRISSILALSLALTACENRPDNKVLAEAEERAASRAGDDGKIECAIDGASEFTRDCYTERLVGENGVTMIIRHPDGGFRRFNILTDGHGLEAADGFDKARVSIVEDGKILVSVGPDQYLLPAQFKTGAKSAADDDPAQAGR
tara:strand:- start:1105 stop:1536 length:432 start_codon:yes stop_codon:yes gene_type:complete